uniref:Variant surface glycoprotein n=1 Tax=Trypanosoma brucei TaxID=5691 RepID=A0A1V0FZX6_9TRYP|nr:variant surface glycoprotein [Trypanosoma brucei]
MLLAATALLVTANVAVEETGTAAKAVQDECTEKKYLADFLTHFSGKLNNLFGTVQALSKQQKQLKLAAQQHATTKLEMAYTLLEAVSTQRLQTTIAKQQAATTAVTQLSEQVGHRAGVLLLSRQAKGKAAVAYKTAAKEDTATAEAAVGFNIKCEVHPVITKAPKTKCDTANDDDDLSKAGNK